MDLVNLLISLVSGAVGGNIAGAAAPDKSLGSVGNSVAGLLGGGAGNYILQALGVLTQAATHTVAQGAVPTTGTEFDIGALLANIGGSGAGGAILTIIVGLIKNFLQKK